MRLRLRVNPKAARPVSMMLDGSGTAQPCTMRESMARMLPDDPTVEVLMRSILTVSPELTEYVPDVEV